MAGATYYAWSPIVKNVDETGKREMVNLGDSVSASDLDMEDEDFEYLIAAKAVREQPYPESLVKSQQPPSDYFKELLAGASEGTLTDEQTKELAKLNLGHDAASSSYLAPSSEDVEDVSGTTGTTTKATASKAT